jgi:septum formation protein
VKSKTKTPAIILASASPRRAELLRDAGISFTVSVSPADEPEVKPSGIPTELWPMCLAYMKATAVQRTLSAQSFRARTILAADSIVVAGTAPREKILNKAADRSHARRILSALNRKTHRVITGCCLLRGDRIRLFSATATCKLTLSKSQLEAYLDSNQWRGKAGAYGIQDPASHAGAADPFVRLFSGEITTVVGLPIPLVQSELASFLEDHS